jgi:hypothetical protein
LTASGQVFWNTVVHGAGMMDVLLLQSEVSEFEDQLEQVEGFNIKRPY